MKSLINWSGSMDRNPARNELNRFIEHVLELKREGTQTMEIGDVLRRGALLFNLDDFLKELSRPYPVVKLVKVPVADVLRVLQAAAESEPVAKTPLMRIDWNQMDSEGRGYALEAIDEVLDHLRGSSRTYMSQAWFRNNFAGIPQTISINPKLTGMDAFYLRTHLILLLESELRRSEEVNGLKYQIEMKLEQMYADAKLLNERVEEARRKLDQLVFEVDLQTEKRHVLIEALEIINEQA